MSTYVVSDLHGHYDVFERALRAISLCEHDYLYVLGDAIDRGSDGVKILKHIMNHDNMDLILGNHELMMLGSVDMDGEAECTGPDTIGWLFLNGGNWTFEEYGKLSLEERRELLKWLHDRYVIKTIKIGKKEYCLSHSYFKENCRNKRYRELKYADAYNITWSSIWREDAHTHAEDIYSQYDYTFITGHVPVHIIRKWFEGEDDWNILKSIKRGNLINIDGGCAIGEKSYNNGAIVLRLDDMKEWAIPI